MKGAPEEEYFRINTDLTSALAKAAKENGVKHFVFISTAHVFGDSGTMDHKRRLDESSPCNPTDPYGRSKLAAEAAIMKLADSSFKVSILRPPMIYGEGAKGNLLSLIKLIRNSPILPLRYKENRRSLVYVGNLVHFIHLTLKNSSGGIFLPQDEKPISIYEITELLKRATRKKVHIVSPRGLLLTLLKFTRPKLHTRLFGTLALESNSSNQKVGYIPQHSTEEGLSRMVRSMKTKLRVARVVTIPEAVLFHLRNTLNLLDEQYELTVIGTNVSQFRDRWPKVRWVDLIIARDINPPRDCISLLKLTWHFIFHRYDLVHSIMPKAGLLVAFSSFVARVPVRIHTFTGQIWTNKSGALKNFYIQLDQLTVKLNTATYTDSPSQSQFLFEHGIRKSGKPLPVIGDGSLSGVDLKRFRKKLSHEERRKRRQELGINTDAFVFTFVGRKCQDKGVFELLEAFLKLSQTNESVHLLLIGPDDDLAFREKIKKFEHLPGITNLGYVEFPEAYLDISDVFCLPSYREGFGTVVIEAAAMQLPSIGTNIPGLVDAIQNGITGIRVNAKDASQLFQAMEELSQNREMSMEMGKKAYERAKNLYSADRLFYLLTKEYHTLIGNR